jgi:hypothetical protein
VCPFIRRKKKPFLPWEVTTKLLFSCTPCDVSPPTPKREREREIVSLIEKTIAQSLPEGHSLQNLG